MSLLGIFSLIWTLMSNKPWGFSCFLIRNMFDLLVVYFTHLAPHVHFSCIAHSHLMHTPLLPLPCLGLYLVFSFLECHVYFMFCSILFLRCFAFCLSIISHSSCTSHASLSLFISSYLSLILLGSFVYSCQKGGEYTREYRHLVY